MNNFDSFRNRQVAERRSADLYAAKFIFQGSMSTKIVLQNDCYDVGFVYDNREEEDKAFVYVMKPHTFPIGETLMWRDGPHEHYYLIYDEEKSVKKVIYNKYLCFECNVQVDGQWAYLSGPRSTYVNTQLRQALYEVSLAKPVLITGINTYEVSSILTIGECAWRIIEKDNYSAPGLVYYYLEQYVTQKDTEEAQMSFIPDEPLGANEVRPGDTVTIITEDGFFEADYELHPQITPTSATFVVPYDVTELNIVYKTDGSMREVTYKVVM